MALLREQRNLIRVLQGFHKDNLPSEKVRYAASAYFGGVDEMLVPRYLFGRPIFLDDEKDFTVPDDNTPEFRHRRSRIGELYQSCLDSGFISPLHVNFALDKQLADPSVKVDMGIRITDRGSDLLHPLGFATIFLNKYKPIEIVLGSSVVTGFLVWVFTSTPAWLCHFVSILKWCQV